MKSRCSHFSGALSEDEGKPKEKRVRRERPVGEAGEGMEGIEGADGADGEGAGEYEEADEEEEEEDMMEMLGFSGFNTTKVSRVHCVLAGTFLFWIESYMCVCAANNDCLISSTGQVLCGKQPRRRCWSRGEAPQAAISPIYEQKRRFQQASTEN